MNIIANAVLNGQSVAVVSNNNSATSNVAEKLGKQDLAFITAFLGSRENKNTFLEQQQPYPDMTSWVLPQDERQKLTERVKKLRDELGEMLEARNRIAAIEQQRLLLEPEQTYFEEYYASCPNIVQEFRSIRKFSSVKLSNLWLVFEEAANNLNFWGRTSVLFRFGKQALGLIKRDAKEAIPLLQHLFYEKKQIELQAEKEGLEKKLNGYRFNERMDELRMLSMRLFKAELAKRYPWRSVRQRFEMRDFRANSSAFNSDYPVILSTTYSIKGTLSTDHIYDYLIIDEASQVDLATGVLALSCAKNVVIVGDLKQLPNVLTEQTRRIADSIWNRYSFDDPFCFMIIPAKSSS